MGKPDDIPLFYGEGEVPGMVYVRAEFSLRDLFAAAALVGFCSREFYKTPDGNSEAKWAHVEERPEENEYRDRRLAKAAYSLADALLAERSQEEPDDGDAG